MNVLKKKSEDMPLAHFVNYFKKNSKTNFYSGQHGWNNKLRLAEVEKIDLFKSRIDTITIIDPNTYKHKEKEITHTVDLDDVRGIRFVQEWYWDKSKNLIFSKLLAIAPFLDHTDTNGNFLFQAPLFYRRSDE